MPMLEALKHRRRYGCELRGGLLHAELSSSALFIATRTGCFLPPTSFAHS